MKGDKDVFDIVDRRRACVKIVSKLERDLDCAILAKKLNAISASRRPSKRCWFARSK